MHLPTRPQLLRGLGTPSDRPIHSLNGSFGKHKSLIATSQHSSPERTRRWDLQSLAMVGMVPTLVPKHSGDRQGDLKFKVRLSYIVRFYLKNMRRNKIKTLARHLTCEALWFLPIAALRTTYCSLAKPWGLGLLRPAEYPATKACYVQPSISQALLNIKGQCPLVLYTEIPCPSSWQL